MVKKPRLLAKHYHTRREALQRAGISDFCSWTRRGTYTSPEVPMRCGWFIRGVCFSHNLRNPVTQQTVLSGTRFGAPTSGNCKDTSATSHSCSWRQWGLVASDLGSHLQPSVRQNRPDFCGVTSCLSQGSVRRRPDTNYILPSYTGLAYIDRFSVARTT